jgi:hypothetical protein
MSEQDAQKAAEEAIDTSADAAKKAAKFIPLVSNLGGGVLTATAAIVFANMSVAKFRTAYEISKKRTP